MADGGFAFAFESPHTGHHLGNRPAFAQEDPVIFRILLVARQAKRAGRVGRS
jgi:hypothetical protein